MPGSLPQKRCGDDTDVPGKTVRFGDGELVEIDLRVDAVRQLDAQGALLGVDDELPLGVGGVDPLVQTDEAADADVDHRGCQRERVLLRSLRELLHDQPQGLANLVVIGGGTGGDCGAHGHSPFGCTFLSMFSQRTAGTRFLVLKMRCAVLWHNILNLAISIQDIVA